MSTEQIAEEGQTVVCHHPAPVQAGRIPVCVRLATRWLSKPGQMVLATALIVVLAGVPVARAERPLGIDVSSWTVLTPAEWTAIRDSGRVFGFARASYGWGYSDSQFVNHMTNATAAGLYMGAYHYSYPGYTAGNTPINEANTFLNAARNYIATGYVRPVLDVEEPPASHMGGLTLTQWVNQWMDHVEQQTGVEPLIYTGAYFAQSYLEPSICSRDLWIAAWPSNPNPQTDNPAYLWLWPTWRFWQYAGDVTIPGVTNQKVDLNVFNGTAEQLLNYVIGPKPTIGRAPASLTPSVRAGLNAPSQTFTVSNSGEGTLAYSITVDQPWLSVAPTSGTSTGPTDIDTITVTYATSALVIGTHTATIEIDSTFATNAPQTIAVTLTVEPVPGDFDADGHVDDADVALFQGCISGATVPQTDPDCQVEDIDNDDDVDQADFGILQGCYRGIAVPADPYCWQ